jgi:sugar phosphate isomerase/epimerase
MFPGVIKWLTLRTTTMTVIQINVPYPMLLHRTDFAVKNRINPEIYFSGDDLDQYRDGDIQRLSETLHQHQLEITFHAPFMDLSPGGVDQRVKEITLDRFSKVIELARFFKPKSIVFHPGYEKWKFNGNTKMWLDSSLQTWGPLVDVAEKQGQMLVIENVFEETPDTLLLLLSSLESPYFRFCFDTGHHNVFSKVSLSVWLEALGKYLAEVHLHDNHREADEHLPVGEGEFDFKQFFALVSEQKLSPIYTLEPHDEEHLWRGLEAVRKYVK